LAYVRGWLKAAGMAVLAGLAAEVRASPTNPVAGVEAVRVELARAGRVSIIAELRPPVPEDARERLARELAPAGVRELRDLGSLPYVVLEVDARQLDALLATGRIAAVALNRPVKIN